MPLRGDAGFKYDRGAGVVTHALNFPLFRMEAAKRKTRFSSFSLDGSNLEVLTIGSGLPEITALVRFSDDPWGLLDLLEAGADGYTLTYYPSLAVPATNYPFLLVEPSATTIQLLRDASERGPIEHAIQLRLRRVDGGDLTGLFP